jgi:hypothetical protein
MDKDLPGNESWQENDLSLPDQEAAWQNMKQKLEEDERKKRVIPPFFLNCAGWATLVVAVMFSAWFLLYPRGKSNDAISNESQPVQNNSKGKNVDQPETNPVITNSENSTLINKERNSSYEKLTHNSTDNVKENISIDGNTKEVVNLNVKTNRITNNKSQAGKQKNFDQDRRIASGQSEYENVERNQLKVQKADSINSSQTDSLKQKPDLRGDTVKAVRKEKLPALPSLELNRDALAIASFISARQKEKSSDKNFNYSAGIGLQQQIPFSGQTSVPYNYYGRKGSLSDYIPSVYLKMQKDKEWYFMGEFRFGAPQSLKEFSYSRKTNYDTATGQYIVTSMNLKKTYYHQLPLSFNYYIKPGLSLGIGGIYSRFYGAVTETEIRKVNLMTQTQAVNRKINRIQNFTDSFLYKTQVHLLLQAGYEWKRVGVGLRFTKDIQPYIRYTKPDGQINEEKNQTLQLILRYDLWKQRQ